MNYSRQICDTYAALAHRHRFEMLLLLAEGPQEIDGLCSATGWPYSAVYACMTSLRDRGLVAVERIARIGSGAQPIRYGLSPKVRITDEQLVIRVGDYEIPINRGLTEEIPCPALKP